MLTWYSNVRFMICEILMPYLVLYWKHILHSYIILPYFTEIIS